jgi:hypothetical protein
MALTFKHKHYDMRATLVEECKNRSLKVILTDNTAPTAKLRKPKNYTITQFDLPQWDIVNAG